MRSTNFGLSSGKMCERKRIVCKAALVEPASFLPVTANGPPSDGILSCEPNEELNGSGLPSTATPTTGKIVSDAVIPCKCEDPPAKAIIANNPLLDAASAYSCIRLGVRCAE